MLPINCNRQTTACKQKKMWLIRTILSFDYSKTVCLSAASLEFAKDELKSAVMNEANFG